MKFLLVTDLHLGLRKDAEIWHKVLIGLFQEIIDTCSRRNISKIIHLGDWHDNRKALSVKTIITSWEVALMLEKVGIELYTILGNHDIFYKNQLHPHSLKFFQKFQNIHIIDRPFQLEDIVLIPWITQIPDGRSKYLFGHFAINSFDMGNKQECKGAWKISDFKKFEQVVSGHFHKPQDGENITYLGAPFQHTFNDVDQVRGYYIWENGELEFINFTNSPKFVIIDSEKIVNNELDLSELKGNIVKVVYTQDHGTVKNNEILEEVYIHKPLQLHTNLSRISCFTDEIREEDWSDLQLKSNQDVLIEYITKMKLPEHIIEKTLIGMIRTLVKEL